MFLLSLSVSNPFVKPADWSTECKDVHLWGTKNLTIEVAKTDCGEIFAVELDTNFSGYDHAGPSFCLTILWLYFSIAIYDSRHWNYDEGRWMTEEEHKLEV